METGATVGTANGQNDGEEVGAAVGRRTHEVEPGGDSNPSLQGVHADTYLAPEAARYVLLGHCKHRPFPRNRAEC